MVKERKLQSGVSNLSSRLPLTSPTPTPAAPSTPTTTTTTTQQQQQQQQAQAIGSTDKSNFTRAWSHQLLAPEMYHSSDTMGDSDQRKKKLTATWKPSEVTKTDFTTTSHSSYINPKAVFQVDYCPKELSSDEIAAKNEEVRRQKEAVHALCQVVKSTHGTVAAMLRAFNKKRSDNLSLYELSNYLKRHQLDSYVSEEEIKTVFQYVYPTTTGTSTSTTTGSEEVEVVVPVKDFLQKVEEIEFNRQEGSQESQKIKDFLELQLQRQRELQQQKEAEAEKDTKDFSSSKLKLKSLLVANEAEEMRKALGMKTYNVSLGHEEMNAIIEDAFNNELTDESHRKYARFLHHSNLKIANIPFYDSRAIELDRLKHRAIEIHEKLEDPILGKTFEEKTKTYLRGSLSTCHSQDFLKTFKPIHRYDDLRSSGGGSSGSGIGGGGGGGLAVSQSMPVLTLSARPSPLAAIPSSTSSSSTNQQHDHDLTGPPPPPAAATATTPVVLSPIISTKDPQRRPGGGGGITTGRNLVTDSHRGRDIDSATITSSSSSLISPPRQLYHGDNTTSNTTSSQDFFPTIYNDHESMGRMKDPAKVLRIEKVDPLIDAKQGRRTISYNINHHNQIYQDNYGQRKSVNPLIKYLNSTLQHGRLKENGDGDGTGGSDDVDDHYLTMTNKFYAPLEYNSSSSNHHSSGGITRNAISDAELAFRTKEYRRQQRYQRKQANMEVTKNRLEYENMIKELQSLHRTQARIEDNIRYKTSIFLQDLRAFRTQPLQRMAKRQNIELADRMWRGSQAMMLDSSKEGDGGGGGGGGGGGKQDFLTTYNSSFDSSILRQSPNINSLEGLRPNTSNH
eukprot:scaffold440_cov277-Ochromonas_danica.AAC.6